MYYAEVIESTDCLVDQGPMREVTLEEAELVNGGLTLEQGQALIGAATLFAGVVSAPAAAAFGGGVLVGMSLVWAFR
jgi:hypothetical protein